MLRQAVRRGFSSAKNVAVVLSGCGVYDGAEITEAVSVLTHLSRAGVSFQCYAPDKSQAHVIDHTKGEPTEEERNVLAESARISRGACQDLADLNSSNYDALLFPGGFGAAKNLSTFGMEGPDMSVDSSVEDAIKSFHSEKKPIGLCCISPIIIAKVLGTKAGEAGVEITLGKNREGEDWPFAGSIGVADTFGNKLVDKDVNECHIDHLNNVVTSPAFMKGTAAYHEVFDGVGKMVKEVLKRA